MLFLAALPWLAVLSVTRRIPLRVAPVALVVAALSVAAATPVQASGKRSEPIATLQRTGEPLALFGGTSIAPPGWEARRISEPYGRHPNTTVILQSGARRATLTLSGKAADACTPAEYRTCRQVDTSPYGPIVESGFPDGGAPYVHVTVPGGHCEISVLRSGTEAGDLLAQLRRVDAPTFVEAAY